jgi:ATP-dependent DNA helicase MPH1
LKRSEQVINKFKAGQFNVLVATSVGEEGLDIGEIDLIVCYDAQKTPIRMVCLLRHIAMTKQGDLQNACLQLQRVGRTGRKREGFVHVLLSEGREEFNLEKAKATYKDVQKTITRGEQLELYGDVKRLLPVHVKPECLEKVMEIVEYVREDGRRRSHNSNDVRSPEKAKKRQRNNDMTRNIPPGASTGFVSVANLLVKGSKMRKKAKADDFDVAAQDDDTDLDLEAGIILVPPRRVVSTSAAASTPPKSSILRKAATMQNKEPPAKKRKTTSKKIAAATELTASQFINKAIDDSDDMDIEHTIVLTGSSGSSPLSPRLQSHNARACSTVPEIPSATIELTSSDDDHRSRSVSPAHIDQSPSARSKRSSPSCIGRGPSKKLAKSSSSSGAGRHLSSSPRIVSDFRERSMAWLVDEDDDPDFEIINSSPAPRQAQRSSPPPVPLDDPFECTEDSAQPISSLKSNDHSGSPCRISMSSNSWSMSNRAGSFAGCIRAPAIPDSPKHRTPTPASSPPWRLSSSPPLRCNENSFVVKLPSMEPPGPLSTHSHSPPDDTPDSSFPIRPKGKQRKTLTVSSTGPEMSPLLTMEPLVSRRLRRQRIDSSPEPIPKAQKRAHNASVKSNPLIDTEAIHSGDEVSVGSSHSDEDIEHESDRSFLKDTPNTQVSPSYDQSFIYRQSLLTQAPSNGKVPIFARRPARRGLFTGGGNSNERRRRPVYSPPSRFDYDSPDEYAFGSFVVDDDAEIS